ncbi:MAG: tRNA-splicing endonuclease subunit [Caeruleum heppii]|nr:MAG: tRNA-splicing endonuclease subunit [Caeruleum heppii]
MAASQGLTAVNEPFPIFRLSSSYLLYDIAVITHVRHKHNICGVLIGSLPQLPQQNLFLGVPLHLMLEEARLLVEKGAAYIVDDRAAHRDGMKAVSLEKKSDYRKQLKEEGLRAARDAAKKQDAKKEAALKKLGRSEFRIDRSASVETKDVDGSSTDGTLNANDEDGSPFAPESPSDSASHTAASIDNRLEPYSITPTTSYPPLVSSHSDQKHTLPDVPASYPLFRHLNEAGYFLSPGLRFGCQYMAYPGDPLRFHSHFLTVGVDWDDELDLLDIVGGGRLGTGVKKGFLLGGLEENRDSDDAGGKGKVRTFCIEWGGM